MFRLVLIICLVSIAGSAVLSLRAGPWHRAEEKAQTDAGLLAELSDRPDRIGLRLTEDLSLKRAMLWSADTQRVYPTPKGLNLLLYEFSEEETRRLTALQMQLDKPVWEYFDASGSELLYCRATPAICLVYDRSVLEEVVGVRHGTLLAINRLSNWSVLLIAIAVISGGMAFWLARRTRRLSDRFSLVPERHSAMRGTTEIPLNARDLKLLALLEARNGVVATKDELYDAGWGREFMPNSRALDQHMINLRRKLDPDKSLPVLIETVHGVGYRLVR